MVESVPRQAGVLLNSVGAEANGFNGPSYVDASSTTPSFRLKNEHSHDCGLELECIGGDGGLRRLSLSYHPRFKQTYSASLAALCKRIEGDVADALRATDDMRDMSESAKSRLEDRWNTLPFGVGILSARGTLMAMNLELDAILSRRSVFLPLCQGNFALALRRDARQRLDNAIRQISERGASGGARSGSFTVGETKFRLRNIDMMGARDRASQMPRLMLTAQEPESVAALRP